MTKPTAITLKRLSYANEIEALNLIPTCGQLKIINNNYLYLDVCDDFIHSLYPMIQKTISNDFSKPDYFCRDKDYIGAHISVIYPGEVSQLRDVSNFKEIIFDIDGLYQADFFDKRYCILKVVTNELNKIRVDYELNDKPMFKGCLIDFHITVAVKKFHNE